MAIVRINPVSPIRLYIMAWIAALLASPRENHQPIKMKERMPTPSQPINKVKRFLADTRRSIKKRNIIKVFKKADFFGSEAM